MAPVQAFVDVLAFYGDFRGARTLLAKSAVLKLDDTFAARNAVIGRLLAQQAPTQTARIVELKSFLELAVQRKDESARPFLDVLQQGTRPAEEALDPASAQSIAAAFADRTARGGVSRGLVSVARQLSRTEFANKNTGRAVELELASLNAELELENVASMFTGPLPSALSRVCLYSKASRRISEFGNANLALLLAKTAVNELQAVRKSVRQLPQQLQLCFAELVSNHYRWLADLFVRQKRFAEAEKVLGFLKNFETFEFLDRDDRFQGNAFESLPLSPQEVETQRAITGIVLPSAQLGQRERELELKQKGLSQSNRSLSAAEQGELAGIKAQLRAQSEKTAALLTQIERALKDAGGAGEAARLQLGSVQGRLRNEYAAKAVAIHYVILPDRMHIILTMPVGAQLAFTWDSLDGAPFTEDALNKKIVDFRTILQKPSRDTVAAARALYGILIAPFEKEIAAAKPTTILVSADKKLRLLPFAALHDGSGYLARSKGVVMMTSARAPARQMPADVNIAAFGTTKAFPGFVELPNVKLELDGLVRGKQSNGLFAGQEYIDKDFTRGALASGLLFGTATNARLGMVHIASHFKLGTGEADSFLLLGNGDRLSIRDIRQNMGASREFDFGDVDLLTLSACETAYAQPGTDGRALESFATATQEIGVRSVVGTLWPIADQTTPILMRQFYALSAKQGVSRGVALAQAQKSLLDSTQTAKADGNLLRDYSHPYYWAPFILMQGMQ
jgi:CHAT domain-containing protein